MKVVLFYEPVLTAINKIWRIVVTISLRYTFFSFIRFPTAGYIRMYKTLYHTKLQFFWHKMQSDIHRWIKTISALSVKYYWLRRGQDIIFSWSVNSPFAITQVTLLIPGKYTNNKSNLIWIKVMCDMSQSVVVVSITDEFFATLVDNVFNVCLWR